MSKENLSEKISVNVNSSVLSEIDLLVDNGYYSNRSDFFNHALHLALDKDRSTLERLIANNSKRSDKHFSWFFGVSGFTAKELDEMYENGETLSIMGYGVFTIASDCDPEKLFAVVKSIKVRGKVICNQDIKKHYSIK